ncbi:cytochrome P-450 like protein [Novosphingobium marinum]|nr:cytochrome P-450 like protein [Novosphingobium marinum]
MRKLPDGWLGFAPERAGNMTDNTGAEAQQLPGRSLLEPEIQESPFEFYDAIREQAPAYRDPDAGFWVISRYDDIRRIVTDPQTFSSSATVELARDAVDPERAAMARELYRSKGWEPAPTLSLQDDPEHRQNRALFTSALRAGKVRELDPFIRQTAFDLVDKFRAAGACDIVEELAVPLPLIAICSQVGVPIEDIWKIKGWTDAWVKRFSMMQSLEEERDSIEQEIEFQHYFRPIVERLQDRPDGSLLSDLVNIRKPDGSRLSYAQIVSHLLADLFVGGSETSTNAIAEGVLLLCRDERACATLQGDLDRYLPTFIEEVLRLQSPVQGLYRVTTRDVEIGGQGIRAGSLLNLRFAAANRDDAQFACPAHLDLERGNAGSHIAFGSGIHHCVGAPLARREMHWAFEALLSGVRNLRLAKGEPEPSHWPGLMLRALRKLPVEFDPVEA